MRSMDVGTMLEQSAARFGDDLAVAVVGESGTDRHTFASLDRRSNRVANGLLEAGVGEGDPVALLSRNSLAFVEAFFATQKIGAPVVPINVRFDRSDVTGVLAETDPSAVVVEDDLLTPALAAEFVEGRPDGDDGVHVVGGHERFGSFEALTVASADPPGVSVGPDAVDGYFYTSGSTGRPKGVVHRHSDRVFVDFNVVAEFGVRRGDVNCLPLPLFHSGPLYTGLVPFLQFGAPTVVVRDFAADRTLRAVEEWDVTVLGGVPAQYERLAGEAADGAYDLDSLRFWWVSGAPMPDDLRRRCHDELCQTHSIVYGATEVGPPVSTLPPEDSADRPTSCGTGHVGQRIRIVDPAGDPDPDATVDRGRVGELVVRGESVMDRYLDRPTETEAVLVDGWFFTGDLARRDEAGYIYVEGRTDDMILSGGEKIYPTEIENVLHTHDGVADVAVLGVSHEEWGETPKAFVVPAADADLDAAGIDRFCRESDLADYKRPREVAFVEEIPRNPSGGSVLSGELRELDSGSEAAEGS